MHRYHRQLRLFLTGVLFVVLMCGRTLASEEHSVNSAFASVAVEGGRIEWHPQMEVGRLKLIVVGPQGTYYEREFQSGRLPYFEGVDIKGQRFPDGACAYELHLMPVSEKKQQDGLPAGRTEGDKPGKMIAEKQAQRQSGAFLVQNGLIVSEEATIKMEMSLEKETTPHTFGNPDHVINDDVIITGSECVGFDCAEGESFGYCTQIYKENNLEVCFVDTSIGTFATNDWKIQINDSASGGPSYFGIKDVDGNVRPFTIEAGAPAHSLYVEDYGRIGLGTSTPYVELHMKDGDSPTIRLDQDGSSGWAEQSWDLAGNETNFFIRDVTNGSKLSFRIQPNTPTNTLCLRSTGYVGIGTWTPQANLHVLAPDTDSGPLFLVQRTGGAQTYFSVKDGGDVELFKTIGEGSDRNLKKNIHPVDTSKVLAGVVSMPVSTWNYKVDADEVVHMGPMAQDFYAAFGLGNDDKHIASLDASGVCFAAIQELNKHMEQQDKMIRKQAEVIQKLQEQLTQLIDIKETSKSK